MNSHYLTHLLSEILVLGALVFPAAIVLAALVGLTTWIIGGQEMGFQASWITWCATMGLVPVALRVSCGPDTRAICERCITSCTRPLRHRESKAAQPEQRRHPRYRVALRGTFFNERINGFIQVGNVSAGGCRVASKVPITTGDVGQLLIDLPGGHAPLKVPQALVRWVTGSECGMEFLRLEPDEQSWLNRLIGQLGAGTMGEEGRVLS